LYGLKKNVNLTKNNTTYCYYKRQFLLKQITFRLDGGIGFMCNSNTTFKRATAGNDTFYVLSTDNGSLLWSPNWA